MTKSERTVLLPELMRWALNMRAEQALDAVPSPRDLAEQLGDLPQLRQNVFAALEERERAQKQQRRRPLRTLVKIFLVAAVLVSAASGLLMARASLGGAQLGTVFEWQEDGVHVNFQVSEPYLEQLPEDYGPHYIPEGLSYQEEHSWIDEEQAIADFYYRSDDETRSVDISVQAAQNRTYYCIRTDEEIHLEKTEVNGAQAHVIAFEDGYMMFWVRDGIEHFIDTDGPISREELYKIAENIY